MTPIERFRCFVLIAGLALGLAPRAEAAVFNPETFTLENGLQVVVIPNHRAPVVTLMVWYRVGAMDEPPGKSGLAHFLEHLMFKGTDNLEPGEFSQTVARNGGRDNAFTSQDYTGYVESIAVDRLDLLLRLEADRMTGLRLTDEDIEPERKVVIEERLGRTDNNPRAQLAEQTRALIYANHPYRIPVIGWEHEIKSLTRDDITKFYRTWYAPNNAFIVLSGDVTAAEVRPMVEEHFGELEARELPKRIDWQEPPKSTERRIALKHPRVRQPSWTRRYLAPSYMKGAKEHVFALEVLSEIIGGGATGRLYRSLVIEDKVAISAGAWYDPGARGPAEFGFFARPRPGKDVAAVEGAAEAVIEKLLAQGVTEDEVKRAIRRLQAAAIYARDSLRTPVRVVGSALVIGQTIEDVESWPERIGAVTVERVNRAAKAVLAVKGSVTAILLPEPTS